MADNLYPENTYKCSLEKFTKPCIWLFWNVTFFCGKNILFFEKSNSTHECSGNTVFYLLNL